MKNIFTFVFLLLFSSYSLLAQATYTMQNTPTLVTDPVGTLYDDGGADGFYSDQLMSNPQVFTICPENSDCLIMDFQEFITENTTDVTLGDILHIYDGPDTSAPLIGSYSGNIINSDNAFGQISASSGCLTLEFDENGAFTTNGWIATWTSYTDNCPTQEDFGPPNDCINSVLICGNETITYLGNGIGEEELLSQNIEGCMISGETVSAWLDIRISDFAPSNSSLTFTLNPSVENDLDFVIYGPDEDCNNLGQPIRCTYADDDLVGSFLTGLQTGETDESESAQVNNEGNVVNGFLAPLIVQPGEQYYIIVNSFTSLPTGFDITWGDNVLINNVLDCSICDHVVITPDPIEECGNQAFTASVDIHNGSGFFEYDWSASAPDFLFSNTNPVMVIPPTDFTGEVVLTVAVTDEEAVGCVREGSMTVDILASPYTLEEAIIPNFTCIDVANNVELVGEFGINPNTTITWDLGTANLVEGDLNSLGPLSVSWAEAGVHNISISVDTPNENDCPPFVYEFQTETLPTIGQTTISCPSETASNTFTWSEVVGATAYNATASINGGEEISLNTTGTEWTLPNVANGDEVSISVAAVPIFSLCPSDAINLVCTISGCDIEGFFGITNLANAYCQGQSSIELLAEPLGGIISIDGVETNILNPPDFSLGLHTVKYAYTVPETGCYLETIQTFLIGQNFNTPIINCSSQSPNDIQFTWNDVGADNHFLEISINGGESFFESTPNLFYRLENLFANDLVTLKIINLSPEVCFNDFIATQTCQSSGCGELEVSIEGLEERYCNSSEEMIPLVGIPSGGVFSSENAVISDTTLVLGEMAEAGTYTIEYTYTDLTSNCEYSTSTEIELIPPLEAPTAIECSNVTINSMDFTWESIEGALQYFVEVSVNGAFLAEEYLDTPFYSLEGLVYGDEVSLQIAAIDDLSCIGIFGSGSCIIDVCPEIELNFENLADTYCNNEDAVELSANPSGGTFFVDDLQIEQLEPESLSGGIHTIRYDYTDPQTGCSGSIEQTIEILLAPNSPEPNCANVSTSEITFEWEPVLNADEYSIAYRINGGSYVFASATAAETSFKVSNLNANDAVEFTITAKSELCGNSSGFTLLCSTNDCSTIELSINNLADTYCNNQNPIPLSGTPSGGIFTINNSEINIFDPALIGTGTYTIQYNYTDSETDCTYSTQQTVSVVSPPSIPLPQCTNVTSNEITFVWESIAGADNYEINYQVNGGTAIEESLNVGINSFTITGLNANEEVEFEIFASNDLCGNSETGSIICSTNDCPTLEVAIQNLDDAYCENQTPIQLIGLPSGGIFTINGVKITEFDVSLAGTGTSIVFYEYTDEETGCTYTSSKEVLIVPPPSDPSPACDNITANTINFKWEARSEIEIAAIDSYKISYEVNGSTSIEETLAPSASNFLVTGLNANDEVTFNISANSSLCGNSETGSITCKTNDCPNIELSFSNLSTYYCKNDESFSLQGEPTGGTFSLNGTPIEANINPSDFEIGTYELTYLYTDDATSCTYTSSQNFNIEDVPTEMPIVTCGDVSTECITFNWMPTENTFNYEVVVSVNGGMNTSENIEENSYTLCGLIEADEVSVSVSSLNDCGSGMSGTTTCTTEACPVVELQILNLDGIYCLNDPIIPLTAEPAGGVFTVEEGVEIVEWNPALYGAGTHSVTYTYEENLCSYSTTNSIEVFDLPSADFSASDTTILEEESILLTAEEQEGATPIWSIDGIEVSNDFQYTFTTLDAGEYVISLEIVSGEGCSAFSESLLVTVSIDMAIEDHPFFDTFKIAPNPANDLLQLSLNTSIPTSASLQWYNTQGQLIAAEDLKIEAHGWNYKMDVSKFAKGVYYLHLQTSEASLVRKVLVLR